MPACATRQSSIAGRHSSASSSPSRRSTARSPATSPARTTGCAPERQDRQHSSSVRRRARSHGRTDMRHGFVAALLVTSFGLLATAREAGAQALGGSTQAIVRGHDATLAEQWGTVGLRLDFGAGEVICSGTLIAPKVVVTAAHCVLKEPELT